MDVFAPKLLFLPVSSAEGCGEYMRSLIIADAVMEKWPNAIIQFAISQEAFYAKECPYFTHILKDTPTKLVKEVNGLISELQPDAVIFDASGRQVQMKHAKSIGAKVIFISQHKRKRARGMKISRARVTDSHWVAQPEFVIGPINWFQKKKLEYIGCNEPVFIGSVFATPESKRKVALIESYALEEQGYILFNAGSGGHQAESGLAADIFWREAQKVAAKTALKCVMVFGPNYPKALPKSDAVVAIKTLDNRDFICLLDGAKVAVLGGGDTLLQAVSLNKPTVAIAVSKDQPKRIQACEQLDFIFSSPLDESISTTTFDAIELTNRSRSSLYQEPSGLTIAIKELSRLLV